MTIFSANTGSFEQVNVTNAVTASAFKGDGVNITGVVTANTASYVTYTNIDNKPTLVSESVQVNVFNTTGGDTVATTGSNTFTGVTTFSDTTNSTSYLDGAVHVAGGMSVQKDMRISGSMNINGLLTVVSMSSQYVTSSQYNIGVSKITVNDDDNVRFAGLSVVDSGSASPATASIFWDSLQHRFIYENLSGSSYNSAILMAGPKNTGSLGDEVGLTTGYIPYATGGDHIDNSVIYQSGSNIGIGVTPSPWQTSRKVLQFGGSGVIAANAAYGSSFVFFGNNWYLDSGGNTTYIHSAAAGRYDIASDASHRWYYAASGTAGNNFTFTEAMRLDANGQLGIGPTTPYARLHVSGSIKVATGNAQGILGLGEGNGTTINVGIWRGAANAPTTDGNFLNLGGYDGVVLATGNAAIGSQTERIRVDSSGNVGIGTTNPGTQMEIYRSTSDRNVITRLLTLNNYSTANPYDGYGTGILFKGTDYSNAVQSFAAIDAVMETTGLATPQPDTAFGAGLRFYTGTNGTLTERVRITTSGSVGINTTTPGQKLSIEGSATALENVLRVNNQANYTTRIWLRNSAHSAYWGLSSTSTADPLATGMAAGAMTLGFGNNYPIQFWNGSPSPSVKMTIDSSGNVGIGTTNPSYTLDVNGTFRTVGKIFTAVNADFIDASGTSTSARYMKIANTTGYMIIGVESSGGGYMQTGAPAYASVITTVGSTALSLGTNQTNTIFIDTSQRVGIGITNPSYLLDVNGVVNFKANVVHRVGGQPMFAQSIDNALVYFYAGSTAMVWRNQADNAELMRLTNTGNVGIGTTNPSTKLHLYEAEAADAIFRITPANGTYDSLIQLVGQGNAIANEGFEIWYDNDVGDVHLATTYAADAATIHFHTRTGASKSTSNERLTILGNGNVGIGTTNPGVKLQVQSGPIRSAGITNGTYIELSGNLPGYGDGLYPVIKSAGTIHFANNEKYGGYIEGNDTYMGLLNSSLVTNVKFHTNGVSWLTGGNVGIGTTNPGSYKLQVQGDQYISGTLTEASSIALKENINPIVNALTIISNLRGYTYDRKDGTAKNQAGLIAEEVEQTLPNVVSYDSEGNPSGVQYTKIIAYLVESIKELKKELDTLKN